MSEGAKSNFNGNGLRIKQKKPKNREKTRKKQTRKERKKSNTAANEYTPEGQ